METLLTLVLFVLSQLFGFTFPAPEQIPTADVAQTAEVIRIIDGDTIVVNLDGVEETVRYIGVDTPEPYRDGEPACYSSEATERNRQLVSGNFVRLETDTEDRDRYGRLLRYVYVKDQFINHTLIAEGYATILSIAPNTQYADLFANSEQLAQDSGLGLWSACSDTTALSIMDQIVVDSEVSAEPIEISADGLSESQLALLTQLGIDTSAITITADMITCAQDTLGEARITEITTGELPTLLEAARLLKCY